MKLDQAKHKDLIQQLDENSVSAKIWIGAHTSGVVRFALQIDDHCHCKTREDMRRSIHHDIVTQVEENEHYIPDELVDYMLEAARLRTSASRDV